MRGIGEVIFSEEIWLPANLTWSDLEDDDGSEANVPDIIVSLPLSFVLLAVRYCVEKFCFAPIGRRLSIKDTRTKSSPNSLLDKVVLKHRGKYDYKQIHGWAKQLDWSDRQVERWLRVRARINKPTTLDKFCESSWRLAYYCSIFLFGLIVLWDKPWLWDIKECWRNYPHQARTIDVFWYYAISLAFYCSLFVSQFFDVKRKDFWQMFVHHIAAITLIVFSWSTRLHQIGTLILFVHDFADVLLEAAKITKYSGFKRTCEVVFGIFAVCWVFSRMLVFPLWILKSTMFDILDYHDLFPGFFIFNFFLIVLFMLNTLWTYLLISLIYRVITTGAVVDDVRSNSESNDD